MALQRELKGAFVTVDGALEDDARLVVAIARTAAAHGARILTHDCVDETCARIMHRNATRFEHVALEEKPGQREGLRELGHVRHAVVAAQEGRQM